MAKKQALNFHCASCSEMFSRWSGRCPACESWNTISEIPADGRKNVKGSSANIQKLSEIETGTADRLPTGVGELDIVLGGGIVPGSFILIGGEPGVGKSTLILEAARNFTGKFYYFSGEESPGQIKMRADRMGLNAQNLFISRETDLDSICSRLVSEKPAIAVIDSVQTVHRSSHEGTPGSVGQMKEAASALMDVCKRTMIPVMITGHLTREGSIAGPRLLEHMVDVVLYFESDRLNHYRLLRAVKNRFGPVGEVAIFEMASRGLTEVKDFPSIAAARKILAPGRAFTALREGSRAIGIEVQALVTRTAPGLARRTAEGLDSRRLMLMAAVLEKYLSIPLGSCDIFANLAGGLSGDEPALDLAVCAAIISSYREEPLPVGIAFVGEVGLSGEIRQVGQLPARVRELTGLGFSHIVVPDRGRAELTQEKAQISTVSTIQDLSIANSLYRKER